MKKVLLWVLVLVVSISMIAAFSLTGCKEAAPAEEAEEAAPAEEAEEEAPAEEAEEEAPAEEEEAKEYEVAWLAPMEDVFWYYVRQGMEEIIAKTLDEKGWEITVTQMAPVAAYDITEQTTQFENMVSKEVDAIAVCPTNEIGLIPAVKQSVAAGIPVIPVSATIPSDEILTQCRPDEVESNRQLAIRAIKDNGEAGKCIILYGMPGNITSYERRLGFEKGIAEFPDCEVLDIQPVQFNKELAMTVMENMLTKYPEIDFVFCVNDNSAIGAYEAAAAAGRAEEMVIVGHDGMKDCLQYMLDDKIGYSCFQDPFKMGRDTITALVEYWSGNTLTRDQYMFVCEIIDKANAQSFIDIVDEMAKWYDIE